MHGLLLIASLCLQCIDSLTTVTTTENLLYTRVLGGPFFHAALLVIYIIGMTKFLCSKFTEHLQFVRREKGVCWKFQ